MKVCASRSQIISCLKRLHLSKHFQWKIRNTSKLYSNRSTTNPYRTTTARSQCPMGRKVTVDTTKFPSLDNNPSKQYPPKSAFRKGCSYCSVCAGKRPHKSLAARRGSKRGSPRGKQKTFHVGGTSYVGRVDSEATN